MYGKQEAQQRQIASLTKIMTTMVILDFMDKYKMDFRKTYVNVLGCCVTSYLGGTSAELIEDDSMSVHELLYAMMLPSGNDAA